MELVHNIRKDRFFNALQVTSQQHVVNYINQQQQRLDTVDHKCFPLTKDQTSFLKENMFELAELIGIDPLLPELYSTKCITQRHYNHINRPGLSEDERVTSLLNILLKRSQVDYYNVAKALEKTGQHHIAYSFIQGEGVLTELHAELIDPTVEEQLVAKFKEWTKQLTAAEYNELLKKWHVLGENMKLIALKKSNSVSVFIHLTTLSAVERLNSSLKDGELKSVLEAVFSILLEGRRCEIKELRWTTTDYYRCLNYFRRSGKSPVDIPQGVWFEQSGPKKMQTQKRTVAAELAKVRQDFEKLRKLLEQLRYQQDTAFKVENTLSRLNEPFVPPIRVQMQSDASDIYDPFELTSSIQHQSRTVDWFSGEPQSGVYESGTSDRFSSQGYMEQPLGFDAEIRRRIFSGVDELLRRLKTANQKISGYEQRLRDRDRFIESKKTEIEMLNKSIAIKKEELDTLCQLIATPESDIGKLRLLVEEKERELRSASEVAKASNQEINNLKNLLKLAERKLDERLEQLKQMKPMDSSVEHLTQGIADAKVTETRQKEDVHTVAEHHSSRRASKLPGHWTRLQQIYQPMIEKLSAKPVAAELFLLDILSLTELQIIHCSPTPTAAAEYLLSRLLDIRSDVSYDCFVGALKATGQEHIFLWLIDDDLNISSKLAELIRRKYTFLLNHLNVTDSGLLALLFEKKVIDQRETGMLAAEEGAVCKTERLLSVLSRKSGVQFEEFMIALEQTGQDRVASELRRCRSEIDGQGTRASGAVAAAATESLPGFRVSTMTSVIAASQGRKGNVGGLTVRGNELFVVRSQPKGRIEVYSADNCSFIRDVKIKEFDDVCTSGVHGMTSCDINNCLYVCDSRFIVRVALTDSNEVFVWQQVREGGAQGLSVNSKSNLIVACSRSPSVVEYTTRGELVRVIALPERVKAPQHAIELSNGQFLVSHGYDESSTHGVCIIDASGHRILHSYGHRRGSLRLNRPKNLSVDKDGFIFVADCDNGWILVLDGTLKRLYNLVCNVTKPCSLYYVNGGRNLLFVGERNNDDSRVVVLSV